MDVDDEEMQSTHDALPSFRAPSHARSHSGTGYDMDVDAHDSGTDDDEEAVTPSPASSSRGLAPPTRGRKAPSANVDEAALLLGLRNQST
jgi:hypothetical protein